MPNSQPLKGRAGRGAERPSFLAAPAPDVPAREAAREAQQYLQTGRPKASAPFARLISPSPAPKRGAVGARGAGPLAGRVPLGAPARGQCAVNWSKRERARAGPALRAVAVAVRDSEWTRPRVAERLILLGRFGSGRSKRFFGSSLVSPHRPAQDWLFGLSWSLCAGFGSVVPYFYPIYFAVLLVHRPASLSPAPSFSLSLALTLSSFLPACFPLSLSLPLSFPPPPPSLFRSLTPCL